MLSIAQASTPDEIQQVRELLREYTNWAMTSTEGSAGAPTFEGLEHELATLPGVFAPPDGRLLLATFDGAAAGSIALRRHDATTAEVKRVYVRPEFRGHNIGGQLVSEVIAAAREIGYRRVVLDSHRTMTSAHALYRGAGFHDVDAPPDFPAHLKPLAVFMAMDLA